MDSYFATAQQTSSGKSRGAPIQHYRWSDSEDPLSRLKHVRIATPANYTAKEVSVAIDRICTEILGEALRRTRSAVSPILKRLLPNLPHDFFLEAKDRLLVVPRREHRPPTLVVMSPKISNWEKSRSLSRELLLPVPVFGAILAEFASDEESNLETLIARQAVEFGPDVIADLFFASQPDVMLTRRPRMIPLCVPDPHITLEARLQVSTAGIFCRDRDGDLGVTGCFHGTGPVGTEVQVDLKRCIVKRASEVQDTVFIPLGNGYNIPALAGLGKILHDKEPAKAERVHFCGAVNQKGVTRVLSTDAGMLRARPTVQLRLQTGPDTDQGDSGSALLDENDRVLGFAFERTAYDDFPQFTDWIWASNALRALELTPY